jgi:hypothetical protein
MHLTLYCSQRFAPWKSLCGRSLACRMDDGYVCRNIMTAPVDFLQFQETLVELGTEHPRTGCGPTAMIPAIGEHFLIRLSGTYPPLRSPVMTNTMKANFPSCPASDSLGAPARMIRITLDRKDQTVHSMDVQHRKLISSKQSLM